MVNATYSVAGRAASKAWIFSSSTRRVQLQIPRFFLNFDNGMQCIPFYPKLGHAAREVSSRAMAGALSLDIATTVVSNCRLDLKCRFQGRFSVKTSLLVAVRNFFLIVSLSTIVITHLYLSRQCDFRGCANGRVYFEASGGSSSGYGVIYPRIGLFLI